MVWGATRPQLLVVYTLSRRDIVVMMTQFWQTEPPYLASCGFVCVFHMFCHTPKVVIKDKSNECPAKSHSLLVRPSVGIHSDKSMAKHPTKSILLRANSCFLEDVGGFCTLSNVDPFSSVHPQNHTLALGRMDYIGRGPNFSPSESPYLDQEMVGDVGPCT